MKWGEEGHRSKCGGATGSRRGGGEGGSGVNIGGEGERGAAEAAIGKCGSQGKEKNRIEFW